MARRLRAAFLRPEVFRAEYERNIAQGGLLLASGEAFELREVVEVELALGFADEAWTLEAEVVHCAPAPEVEGGYAVAVQFIDPAPELRDRLARHAAAAPAPEADAAGAGADAAWDVDPAAFDLDDEDEPPTERRERRSAPREPAHRPVRLAAPAAEVSGHTRDLSESGALLALDGNAVPVGGRVRLQLASPTGGAPLEVEGTVTRHLEAEGTVTALAVRFDAEGDEEERLGAFVEAAQQRERLAGGIAGAIEEIGLVNLLQMLGKSSPRGTLTLTRGAEEGVVAFEDGRLRYARLGPLRGTKALARFLSWKRGRFQFYASVDPLSDEGAPEPLDGALLEATRQLDEASRGEDGSPPPATRFRVDREALARAGLETKIEEAVCDLAAAGFTLRRMLDVIPEPDAEVLGALAALEARGVLARTADEA